MCSLDIQYVEGVNANYKCANFCKFLLLVRINYYYRTATHKDLRQNDNIEGRESKSMNIVT